MDQSPSPPVTIEFEQITIERFEIHLTGDSIFAVALPGL